MRRLLPLAALVLAPLPALAHPGEHGAMGFGLAAGLAHPFGGLDHLTAMLALGALAWLSGGAVRSRLALPGAFLGAMGLGLALGLSGVALPMVEAGLLATAVVLGASLAVAARVPPAAAAALAAVAGLLHGHAHGAELAEGAGALAYAAGVLLASLALQGLGAGLALAATGSAGRVLALRMAGGGMAAACLLVALLG